MFSLRAQVNREKILPHLQMKMFILLDIGFTLLEKVPACGMSFIHQE